MGAITNFFYKTAAAVGRGLAGLDPGRPADKRPDVYLDILSNVESKEMGRSDNRMVLSNRYLKQIACLDADTALIINKFKTRLTSMRWGVEPDLGAAGIQIDQWERSAALMLSPVADPKWRPTLEGTALPSDIGADLRTAILKLPRADLQSRRRLRWLCEAARADLGATFLPRCNAVEDRLKVINHDTDDPMATLVERMVDDCLTFDSIGVGMIPNREGGLYEAYDVPGDEIFPMRNKDLSRPRPPATCYRQKVDGRIVKEFVYDYREAPGKAALIHFIANPQKWGTGFSPVEMVAWVIMGTLFADRFNLEKFQHNIPPALLALGSALSPETKGKLKQEWDQDVVGQFGGRARILIVPADKKNVGVIPLNEFTPQSLAYKEYKEWAFMIKCGAFQISPQDVGNVREFKYETSTNQRQISSEGVDEMAQHIESVMTTVITRGMGQQGLRFRMKRDKGMDTYQDAQRDSERVKNGTKTINQIREALGDIPYPEGGDEPILALQGATLLSKVGQDPVDDPAAGDDDGDADDPIKGPGKKPGAKDAKPEKGGRQPIEKAVPLDAPTGGRTLGRAARQAKVQRDQMIKAWKNAIVEAEAEARKEMK